MKYQVLFDANLSQLVQKVNQAMQSGWRPQGGIAVAVNPEGQAAYFQAMVLAGSNQ